MWPADLLRRSPRSTVGDPALTAQFAKELKKGDRVEVTGTLSYRPFKDANDYTRKQATIIGTFIEKIAYNKQEELLLKSVSEVVEEAVKS